MIGQVDLLLGPKNGFHLSKIKKTKNEQTNENPRATRPPQKALKQKTDLFI